MIILIMVRERTDRLTGLSSGDMPFTLKKLGTDEPLVLSTLKRNEPFCSASAYYVILKDFENVRAVVPEDANFLISPVDRDTAPLMALASLHFHGEILLVVPAWQITDDIKSYESAVIEARNIASEGGIAAFGGAFCFRTDTLLDELKVHNRELYDLAATVYESRRSGHATHRFCGLYMERFDAATITDALLCKSDKTVYMKNGGGLKDMDSYQAIYDESRKDKNGNASLNADDAYGVAEYAGAKNNLVMTSDKDITLLGVEGLVVVDTGKKLLIARRDADIETLMKELDS